VITNPAAAR